MLRMKRSVTYTSIAGGQERPYGDTIREGVLEFHVPEGQAWASKMFHKAEDREKVMPYARLFCADWTHEGNPWSHVSKDEPDIFFTNHLVDLSMIEPGKWHVKVVYPYDD